MSVKPFVRLLVVLSVALSLPLWATPAKAGDVDGALRFVPSDAFVVAGVHGERLHRSPHFPKVLDLLLDGHGSDLAALKKATGFDLARDVRAVVMAVRPASKRDGDAVVIAEARVDEGRLVAFLRKQSRSVTKKSAPGGALHVLSNGRALAVRGGFVLAGDEGAVRAALDKRGPSQALSTLLAGVKQRDLFFAAQPTAKQRAEISRRKPELAEMRAVSGGGEIGAGVKLDAKAQLASAKAADRLANQLKAALLVARVTPSLRGTGLEDVIDAVDVKASGKDLTMRLVLDKAQLEKLLRLLRTTI